MDRKTTKSIGNKRESLHTVNGQKIKHIRIDLMKPSKSRPVRRIVLVLSWALRASE